jgi:hypothetical protein
MSSKFRFHGIYLLIVGIISVMYNPHTGAIGFNPNAKSGLIVTVLFAIISFVWAYIDSRGAHRVVTIGGIITTLLLFVGTIPRGLSSWIDVAHGDAPKWFAAIMITLVVLGSIPLFVTLLQSLSNARTR